MPKITITIKEFSCTFSKYDAAINFLQACKDTEENPELAHEHNYNWCIVDGYNFCKCGKIEEE